MARFILRGLYWQGPVDREPPRSTMEREAEDGRDGTTQGGFQWDHRLKPFRAARERIYSVSTSLAAPSRSRSDPPRSPGDQTIEAEQHDRSHHCHDEAYWIAFPVPTCRATKKPAEQRARDAQQHGDDESPGVTPRH